MLFTVRVATVSCVVDLTTDCRAQALRRSTMNWLMPTSRRSGMPRIITLCGDCGDTVIRGVLHPAREFFLMRGGPAFLRLHHVPEAGGQNAVY